MRTWRLPRFPSTLFALVVLGAGALMASAAAPRVELQKKYDAIVERMDSAQKAHEKQVREASVEERRQLAQKRPGPEFLDELRSVAKEAKGAEIGAKAWMRVVTIAAEFGLKDEALEALEALLQEHVKSAELESLPGLLGRDLGKHVGAEKSVSALRLLAASSPHKSIQAGALFVHGSGILRDKKATPERIAEARALMTRLVNEFADVKSTRGQEYKSLAEGCLFEIDNLQIGKVAPDFEVTDENGVKFKLSDYRGKVVVLDFWGNW